jgi:hypothetical protein
MKTITLLIYLFPIIIFSQSAYTKGYNEGFKKGYCYNQPLGCVAPLPYLPTASIKTSFEEGYNDGFIKGTERKQSETTQSNTTPYFPKYEQNQSYSNSETSVYGINLYNTVKEKTNLFKIEINKIENLAQKNKIDSFKILHAIVPLKEQVNNLEFLINLYDNNLTHENLETLFNNLTKLHNDYKYSCEAGDIYKMFYTK